jgi:transposase
MFTNPAGMIEHLRLISQATAKDRQALVIVDRAGWHMTKAIRCFSNVTLLPLPPYSPELNPVEQLWQQIKQRFLCSISPSALSLAGHTAPKIYPYSNCC